MSFQIVDDLLDYGGATVDLGKNTGDDFRERKLTLPVILAVEAASDEERAFWARTIEQGDQRDGDLEHAMEIIARHGTLDATRDTALGWRDTALDALDRVPKHQMRDHLGDLAEFVVSRVS